MADSIRELITKDVVTTLGTITTANLYNNTLDKVSRFTMEVEEFIGTATNSKVLAVLVNQEEEQQIEGSYPKVTRVLTLRLSIWVRHLPVSEGVSSGELLNSVSQDIYKALMVDRTRDGHTFGLVALQSVESPVLGEDGSYALREELWSWTYEHSLADESVA